MAIKDIVKGICNITRCKYDVYTKERTDELLGTKANVKATNITTEGTDLNDYTTAGTYFFKNGNIAPANIPEGINGWLVVLHDGSGVIKQIWYRFGSAGNHYRSFVRTKFGTEADWTEWQRFVVESEITPNFIKVELSSNYTKTTLTDTIPLTNKTASSGTKLTLNSDGTIKIGNGVNSVRISGSASITPASAGHRSAKIEVNSTTVSTGGRSLSSVEVVNLSTTIVNVKSGDVISLKVSGTSGDVIGKNTAQTFLVVEVIN